MKHLIILGYAATMESMEEDPRVTDAGVWSQFTEALFSLKGRRIMLISYEYAKSLYRLTSEHWREVAPSAYFSDRNGKFVIWEFSSGGRDEADCATNAANRVFPNPNSSSDQKVLEGLQSSMDYLANRLAADVEITVVWAQNEKITVND